LLDTLHRWTGGLVGLILALLGLSGAILIHRDAWVMLPHSGDAQVTNIDLIALATDRMMADPAGRPDTLQFASGGFGLNRLSLPHGAGAYADQAGTIVTRWSSQWQRPEIWLFDFHHHLFTGDIGETVIGVVALCGLFFVISGAILWWHTRRTYHFRLLPSRLTRPAILRHHRDLGILLAPLLALSLLTGAILVFRPIAAVVLGPGISAELAKAAKPPAPRAARLADHLRWGDMIRTAHSRFPAAELRLISLPRKDNGLIAIRMRQPEEWLPNGRTMLWFAADSGALVMARDSRDQVWRVKAYNLFYPLHAAKVGGLAYRLVMTLSGLALMLLGGLTVWSFWFGGGRSARRPALKLV
jgi:uncharacterized iron-regulated membrane protein